MNLSEKYISMSELLGDEPLVEIQDNLKEIAKALPHIKQNVPNGDSETLSTARKACDKLIEFCDLLLKDLDKEGINDKTAKGISNYVKLVTYANNDIMKVVDRKIKNVRVAVDIVSNAVRQIETIYKLKIK